jgi:ABC-type antimicrobial peptide transport system permease subunit
MTERIRLKHRRLARLIAESRMSQNWWARRLVAAGQRQTASNSLKPERFTLVLLVAFAALAFLLAAVGIYGVVSYSVTQRTREIGVRMAFGASRIDVLKMVLWQGLRQSGLGMAVGVALSLLLTRYLSSLLYEVSATDPWAFVGAVAMLAVVATAATLIPARRATSVDPMRTLRYE